MGKIQESYRLRARLPRYTTKLSAFANGMYLTKQVIPEGYAKVLVNYDIDDTGSHIRPKKGRTLLQTLEYDTDKLGAINLTDYLYAYDADKNEAQSIIDIAMSYGTYTNRIKLLGPDVFGSTYDKPFYLASIKTILDTNYYEHNEETGEYTIIQEGDITETDTSEFWAIHYDTNKNIFKNITNKEVGIIAARTISKAYAFNKEFVEPVGRPIGTVANNELITFAGNIVNFKKYANNPERNEVSNLQPTELCKLQLNQTGNEYTITRKPVEIKALNALEAASVGFNLLSPEPYRFIDVESSGLEALGIITYKPNTDDTEPVFSPALGETVTLRCYYGYAPGDAELQIKVECIDNIDTKAEWEVLEDFTLKVTEGDPIRYNYSPKKANTTIRFTIRRGDDNATSVTSLRSIVCGENKYDKLELKKFDLSSCKGMVTWNGCVGVYGVNSALDTLFFSDVENPGYFPFPNNTISFDNEILAVHNYLDYLLVITVDSIWLISPGTTIAGSTLKRVMYNIHIPEIDAINLVVLKDQVFFKTDTQFYVLKPNQYTSDATDLKNYINSTAIANYTNTFKESTLDILNSVYKTVCQKKVSKEHPEIFFEDFDVLDTHSVIRNEEVHYIYTIKPKLNVEDLLDERINLHIVYNTLTRSWRLYLVTIGDDTVNYAPILYKNKQSGEFYEFMAHNDKLFITKQTQGIVTDVIEYEDWVLSKEFDSYQYIDTGNVAIDDTFLKRFREVQFNLANMQSTSLDFYVNFKVDGQERVDATKYLIEHITDKEDPQYGKIFVTPIETSNMQLPGTTILADNIIESDHFALDISRFTGLDVATIRFNLQGKGRRGCIQILSTTLKPYELSDINWAFRMMNAR